MFCCAKNSPARLTLARWLEHSAGFIELAGDPLNGRAIATGGRAGVSDAEFRLPVFEIGFQHGDGFVDAADGVVLASALLEPSLRLSLWLSGLPQHTIALRIGFSVFYTAGAAENGCRPRRDPSTAGRTAGRVAPRSFRPATLFFHLNAIAVFTYNTALTITLRHYPRLTNHRL